MTEKGWVVLQSEVWVFYRDGEIELSIDYGVRDTLMFEVFVLK